MKLDMQERTRKRITKLIKKLLRGTNPKAERSIKKSLAREQFTYWYLTHKEEVKQFLEENEVKQHENVLDKLFEGVEG